MRIYALRHGRAVSRSDWDGDDLLRPLDEVGVEQARALADELADEPLSRIVCAPALRCQKTVQQLARERGISVEIDERLAPGETLQRVLELLPDRPDAPILLCAHGDTVSALLRFFELPAEESESHGRCRKGAMWVLDGPGLGISCANYLEPRRRANRTPQKGETPKSVRSAVFDLGSTSFHLLIADVHEGGEIVPVVQEKVMLRLGAVMASHGEIPDDVAERAIEVAREMRVIAEREKVECWLPVATAAIRDAANGRSLARRIGRVIGTPVRVLSGEEEARVIFRAFQHRLDLGPEPALGLDLGGGSLEVVVGNERSISFEVTLPLGVARLARELVEYDPMKKSELRKIRRRVQKALEPHLAAIEKLKPRSAIATGGAVRALGRLVRERAVGMDADAPMSMEALSEVTADLVAANNEERLEMRGIRKARADLLPTAGVILETLSEALGFEVITICDWGLREGLLLESVASNPES